MYSDLVELTGSHIEKLYLHCSVLLSNQRFIGDPDVSELYPTE